MSTTTAFKTALLTLYFNNSDHANIGDASGLQNSASAGSFYVSLHTSSPGATGTQSTNETSYTDYARVAVARSGAGWTVATANVSNAGAITFPAVGGGGQTITHIGIGSDASGAGNLFWYEALDESVVLETSQVPSFSTGELDINLVDP
jgi:hypothetical protein